MKNIKLILTAFIAVLIGLGAGYFFFGGQPDGTGTAADHDHVGMTDPGEEIWTCSMHPQIRQNEPGDCPICGMDLIPLEENGSSDPLVLEMTPEAVKLAQIETTLIGATGSAERSFTLSGKIQADERTSASQVAHVPGRIEQLFITFTGEEIRQGQQLATIYSPELVTAQRELIEALKFEEINTDLVEAARKKLQFWKIPEEQIRAIEESGQVRETFTLLADASGIVTGRRISVGDYVKQGEVLFDVVNLDRLWVLFDAYEKDLASIRVGDRVDFTTPAAPGKTFTTRITFIDPLIDPATRAASVRGEIRNSGNLLKPEMFVRGSLASRVAAGEQLLVPKSAVLWTGTRSVVYVRAPDREIPSFQFREVTLGGRVGNDYLVESGLAPGEEVVTYGSFAIDAAAQLNNQASMMNKDVLVKGADYSEFLPDYTASTPVAFKELLAGVVRAYLTLKDALVATDGETAKKEAARLREALSPVDMSLLTGDSHLYWMEQLEALRAHTGKITELNDVEEQRKQFDFLSQALIRTIKVFGIPGDTFYVQRCPMAFDNTGADWLSDAEEIRNPYFGDQMLTCGTIEDTITKDFKNPPVQQASNAPAGAHRH